LIKKITPERIAFITTIVLVVIFSCFLVFFKIHWLSFLLSLFIFGSLSYIIILFTLEYFIYRKIKLIYKTIHNFKTNKTKPLKFIDDFDIDPIKRVSDEVKEWANDQINEMNKLIANEQYRREFLGNVSHELKTPIFNIQGYIETLLDGAIEDEEVKFKFLNKAATSAERLNTLVNDLLDISKLESGSLAMNFQVFDVNELTREVFETYFKLASDKSIKLKIKETCDEPFKVLADKDRIRQVLNNLIANSINYGGKENGVIKVGFFDMDTYILVEVEDDGDGIEPEHLNRLFERFYRIDKSRSRNSGGSGLGLSIVKHIIESHNQTINVRSSLGKGTTFAFTLAKAPQKLN
jgi:two-component system phosphate regulon sensor histidine kinase PhoR